VIAGEQNETSEAGLRDREQHRMSVVTLVLGSSLASLVAAACLLWLRFGSQVFLDAASTAWRSCF
jgi:hypothetical protein